VEGPGLRDAADYASRSPELRYRVRFPAAGRWYVWIREASENSAADTVYVGLDGKGQTAMDFDFAGTHPHPEDLQGFTIGTSGSFPDTQVPEHLSLGPCVETRAAQGDSLWRLERGQESLPLLHVNSLGSGRFAYLATSDSLELTERVLDWLAGPVPVTVTPPDKQVVLAWQPVQSRWVLHLISDGDLSVDIRGRPAPIHKVIDRYPPQGWSCKLEQTGSGVRLQVRGSRRDRLVALQ
jgi:hypothetical protein